MTDASWKPLSRAPASTVTKILRSPAFLHSRERSTVIVEDPAELRALADSVEALDHTEAPLALVADRVVAAVRFVRARASRLDAVAAGVDDSLPAAQSEAGLTPDAGVATRERLLVAGLHYLVTPVDLVPDFLPGGSIDDVVLLSWVFGVATSELAPYQLDE